jgi:hypothetical protein
MGVKKSRKAYMLLMGKSLIKTSTAKTGKMIA